jgi:hypothetical protein
MHMHYTVELSGKPFPDLGTPARQPEIDQPASADERTNTGIRIPDSEHIDELRMGC